MKSLLYVHNSVMSRPAANDIQVMNMCEAFSSIGVNTTLMAFGKDEKNIRKKYGVSKEFNLTLLRQIGTYHLRTLLLFLRFIRDKDSFDFIFSRDLLFVYLAKASCKDKRMMYELHDFSHKGAWRWLFKKAFKKIDHLVVISQGIKDALVKEGFDTDKISVLQDGVNIERFNIKISKQKARKKMGLPGSRPIVIYTGNTEEERDFRTLIEVSKRLNDVLFVIYGQKGDYIKRLCKNRRNVVLKGYTNKAEIAYKAADVLFSGYTNRVKTIDYMSPLKIFEYMAAKRPIVVADFPRIREILNEEEAVLYKAEDSEDLTMKLNLLLKRSQRATSMAEKAFKKARIHTWEKRARSIMRLFNYV